MIWLVTVASIYNQIRLTVIDQLHKLVALDPMPSNFINTNCDLRCNKLNYFITPTRFFKLYSLIDLWLFVVKPWGNLVDFDILSRQWTDVVELDQCEWGFYQNIIFALFSNSMSFEKVRTCSLVTFTNKIEFVITLKD